LIKNVRLKQFSNNHRLLAELSILLIQLAVAYNKLDVLKALVESNEMDFDVGKDASFFRYISPSFVRIHDVTW